MPSPPLIEHRTLPLIPSDIIDAFVTFIGAEVLSHNIDSSAATLYALKDNAKAVGVACMRSLKQAEGSDLRDTSTVTDKQWQDVKVLLVTLCRFARDGTATAETIKEYQIIRILAMFSNPINGLPFPIPEVAKRLKDIFLLILQGKPVVGLDGGSLIIGTASETGDGTLDVKKEESDDEGIKAEPDSDDEELVDTQQSTLATTVNKQGESPWRRAPTDHPIFGIHGMMHHILVRQDTRKSCKIDPMYTSVSGAVIGDNGFQVGAWFPRQLTMVRDGMHNLTMGGVSGSLAAGAYSVVLSNPSTKPPTQSPLPYLSSSSSAFQTSKYPATDIDLGSVIYYSSTVKPFNPGPPANTSSASTPSNKTPNTNKGSLILAKSIETGHPIRVIRKWTCDFENRPSVGYRYEGLYKAIGKQERVVTFDEHSGEKETRNEQDRGEEIKKNSGDGNGNGDGLEERKSAGYFWTVFKLERWPGQKDIDTSRPTEEEKRDFARIEGGGSEVKAGRKNMGGRVSQDVKDLMSELCSRNGVEGEGSLATLFPLPGFTCYSIGWECEG